jgi:hypothetical protein
MIYKMSLKQSDAVKTKGLLCARPNVQEFLCPFSENSLVIEGRVSMNPAVEETSLHSTCSTIQHALWPINADHTYYAVQLMV